MPAPPPIGLAAAPSSVESEAGPFELKSPYERITVDLRGAIACGALRPGDALPTIVQLKNRYNVSVDTANRAIAELKEAGLVTASRGRRAIVRETCSEDADASILIRDSA